MARAKAFTAKTFGRNLRRLRKARGFTQEGFALMSGVDRSYVGGLERGDRNPALAMILRLAEALDLPPKALFEDGAEGGSPEAISEPGVVSPDPRPVGTDRHEPRDADQAK